jgi:hypothetical protein
MVKTTFSAALLLACTACSSTTVLDMPQTPAAAPSVETAEEVSGEVARCEATGQSTQDCYDSHFLTPPPPVPPTVVIADTTASAIETLRIARHLARNEAHTR